MRIKVEFLKYGKNRRFTHFDPKTNSWWTDDLKSGTGKDTVWGMWVKAENIEWEAR